MTTQTAGTYIVTAEAAKKSTATGQFNFVIESSDYKRSWIDARSVCRLGGTVRLEAEGETKDIKAGEFVVRKIFAVQNPDRQPEVVTVENLLDAASKEGIKVQGKLAALINRLLNREEAA